jgi:hypothetical protein
MSSDIQLLLIGALIGFFVTFLTTIVTHIFQITRDDRDRKWKAEQEIANRWWDRKATAYGNIINTLTDMTYSLGNWLNLEFQRTEGERDLMFVRYIETCRKKLADIEKTETEGSYLISEKSVQALNKLTRLVYPITIDDEDDEVVNLEKLTFFYSSAKECLEIIREETHADLGVNRTKKSLWQNKTKT